MAHHISYILSFLAAIFLFTTSATCWGVLGHHTVAYIAEMYFNPSAASLVASLLDNEDIGDAAVWADQIRPKFPLTKPWHFIDAQDNPPVSCGVDFDRDCIPAEGCVISAIMNHTARVTNSDLSSADRGDSLRFLLHFIGDVHQPLHTEKEDVGGNTIKVRFRRKHTNLHAIWDDDILEKHAGGKDEATARSWASTLFSRDPDPTGNLNAECHDLTQPETCGLLWANDANKFVCSYVLKDSVDSLECPKETSIDDCLDLSLGYFDGAAPIVDQMIGKAGRRLGGWINALAAQTSVVGEERDRAALRLQVTETPSLPAEEL